MRVIERFDHRHVGNAAQRAVHHRADVGIEVDGEDHRHVRPRGQAADGIGNGLHPAAEVLAPVGGDADDAFSGKARLQFGEATCQRGIGGDLRGDPMQRINHRVAGDVDACRIDVLAQQRRLAHCRWRAVQRGDGADDLAVHLLWPRMVDIAGPEASFHVAHADLAVIGRQRAAHGRGGIALHHHPIGLFGIHHRAKAGDQPRRQLVEALVGLHQVKIVVRHHAGDVQHLVQHPAMLPAHADARIEPRVRLQRVDQREQLDRFGPRAEDGEDAHGTVIAP